MGLIFRQMIKISISDRIRIKRICIIQWNNLVSLYI